MFGNCSFDDAIVASVHLVAKHPTFSILLSRFSTHNYRRATERLKIILLVLINRISYLPVTVLGHYILGMSSKFITRFYFPFSSFLSCSFLISSCEFFIVKTFKRYFVFLT